MARTRKQNPTIPTEIPLEPKPRRKTKAIAEVLDTLQVPGLTTAAELAPPEREVIEPEPNRPRSFAERTRPEGPRKRKPGEAGSVFTSVNGGFALTEDGRERAFRFSDALPPSETEKQDMRDIGLAYTPIGKRWAARATPEMRDATDKLALKFEGKDISHGRDR